MCIGLKKWRAISGAFVLLSLGWPVSASEPPPKAVVSGLHRPVSVISSTDGKVFVTARDAKDAGVVLLREQGKAAPFASGMDVPHGFACYRDWLLVADKQQIWGSN